MPDTDYSYDNIGWLCYKGERVKVCVYYKYLIFYALYVFKCPEKEPFFITRNKLSLTITFLFFKIDILYI